MLVCVVAHHSRPYEDLAERLGADIVFVDEGWHGAWWNHHRALTWAAAQSERVWIVEDDAVPAWNFRELASVWGDRFRHDLISGYLGKQRPPQWQSRIRRQLADRDRDFIRLDTLIHGVCYSIPVGEVGRVVDGLTPGPADFQVGAAWGSPVLYTLPSIVDHADLDVVEKHPDGKRRIPGRTAWCPPVREVQHGRDRRNDRHPVGSSHT